MVPVRAQRSHGRQLWHLHAPGLTYVHTYRFDDLYFKAAQVNLCQHPTTNRQYLMCIYLGDLFRSTLYTTPFALRFKGSNWIRYAESRVFYTLNTYANMADITLPSPAPVPSTPFLKTINTFHPSVKYSTFLYTQKHDSKRKTIGLDGLRTPGDREMRRLRGPEGAGRLHRYISHVMRYRNTRVDALRIEKSTKRKK